MPDELDRNDPVAVLKAYDFVVRVWKSCSDDLEAAYEKCEKLRADRARIAAQARAKAIEECARILDQRGVVQTEHGQIAYGRGQLSAARMWQETASATRADAAAIRALANPDAEPASEPVHSAERDQRNEEP